MSLLDAAFLRELSSLRRWFDVRARSGAVGDRLGHRRGTGTEFRDHRAYVPGDDLRRIDWSAFARTGAPLLKTFRHEEDVLVRVLVDASASLGVDDKFDVARKFAAAVAFLTLSAGERVQLFACRDGGVVPSEPVRGSGAAPKLFRMLEELAPSGGTDLGESLRKVLGPSRRPGVLVLVSDFLDRRFDVQSLARFVHAGNDLCMAHVLSPSERDPPEEGDVELEDTETGERVTVTVDRASRALYLRKLAVLQASLRDCARRNGGSLIELGTQDDLLPGVRALLRHRGA